MSEERIIYRPPRKPKPRVVYLTQEQWDARLLAQHNALIASIDKNVADLRARLEGDLPDDQRAEYTGMIEGYLWMRERSERHYKK